MVLYFSYLALTFFLYSFALAVGHIGTRYLNVPIWTLRLKVMTVRVLAVVTLSSELTILDLFVSEMLLHIV